MVSIRRIVWFICYQGDVFDFLLNQSLTTISAKTYTRAKASLANFAAGLKLTPASVVA